MKKCIMYSLRVELGSLPLANYSYIFVHPLLFNLWLRPGLYLELLLRGTQQGVVTPTLPIEPSATGVKIPVKRSSHFLALVKRSRRLLGAGQRSIRIIRRRSLTVIADSIENAWSVLIHQCHATLVWRSHTLHNLISPGPAPGSRRACMQYVRTCTCIQSTSRLVHSTHAQNYYLAVVVYACA